MLHFRVTTKGIVQEKEQARESYHSAVARGDSAQLLEQKRADVFELVGLQRCCHLCLATFPLCMFVRAQLPDIY